MKLYIASTLISSILLLTCCTIESELGREYTGSKLVRISAKDNATKTRASTDGTVVHWESGDMLGVVKVGDAVGYRCFILNEELVGADLGPGTNWGYFDANNPEVDGLEDGSWVATHPYWTLVEEWSGERYTADNPYYFSGQFQSDADDYTDVCEKDILVSSPVQVEDATLGEVFKMEHQFSLIEVRITCADNVPYEAAAAEIGFQSDYDCFASCIYLDDMGKPHFEKFLTNSSTCTVDRKYSTTPVLKNKTHSYFFLARQVDFEDITLYLSCLVFSTDKHTGGTLVKRNYPVPLSGILEPGGKYVASVTLNTPTGYSNVGNTGYYDVKFLKENEEK